MKRILLVAIIIACIAPIAKLKGQDKKSEQKINIVVSDGKGYKTVIDTVLTGTAIKDTLKLSDGRIVFIGHSPDGMKEKGDIYVYSHSGTTEIDKDGKTMAWVSATNDGPENKVIVINSDGTTAKTGPATGTVIVRKGQEHWNAENTKYVISRDGLVISVEGDDYAKVKSIVDEIEAKLDADKPAAEKPEPAKNQKKK
jgi:hypothetical protein